MVEKSLHFTEDIKLYQTGSYLYREAHCFPDTNFLYNPGMMEITKVSPGELDSVMALVSDAIRNMEDNGIHQWDEVYPDRTVFEKDIEFEELYCLKLETVITGIVTLNDEQSAEYGSIQWSDTRNPLVIHRLCIMPGSQGKGLAKILVRFAENFAREHNYSSIRLDAFTGNPKALRLYNSLQYQQKGIVKFRKGAFFCYSAFLPAANLRFKTRLNGYITGNDSCRQ